MKRTGTIQRVIPTLRLAAAMSRLPGCKAGTPPKAEVKPASVRILSDIGYKSGDNLSAYENVAWSDGDSPGT